MRRRELLGAGLGAAALAGAARADTNPGYRDLFAGERRVLRYQTAMPDGQRAKVAGACYSHPLHSPAGDTLTDVGPADHPHHRGVFCAWVNVDGVREGDWWGWGALAPADGRAIVNVEIHSETGDRPSGLTARNAWQALAQPVLHEELRIAVSSEDGLFVVDYDYRYRAVETPAVIAANPFGGFCYRARPRGTLAVWGPSGQVDLPNAIFNRAETNWPAADYYDLTYTTPEGGVNGCAVINHPANPPSTWHVVRNIHMLNPCIVAGGPVTIPVEKPLRLRYRLVTHEGQPPLARLSQLAAAFGRR